MRRLCGEDIAEITAICIPIIEEELLKVLPAHILKYVPETLSKLHLSLQDVAELTGVSYQRVHQLVSAGLLKCSGSPAGVNLGDLFEFLDEREQNPRVRITKTEHGERWDPLPVRALKGGGE